MKDIRAQIDKIDEELLGLLKKRQGFVEKIKEYKKNKGIPTEDIKREEQVIRRLLEKNPGLDEEFVRELYYLIFKESRRIQDDR